MGRVTGVTAELSGLAAEFPGYEFATQPTRGGISIIARRHRGCARPGLYAVITDDPDEMPQQIRGSVPPGQEQQIFDAMARSPHPDAASMLTLIGQRHPDKGIAKAARRSAHRAATRPKRAP